MARVCHVNRCPVGVATQREDLRKKFPGTPEHVANFMLFVAEEVRTILAALGFRRLDEIIGRTDLLRPRGESSVRTNLPRPAFGSKVRRNPTHRKTIAKVDMVDLSAYYSEDEPEEDKRASWVSAARDSVAHSNGPTLDDELLADPVIDQMIMTGVGVIEREMVISNANRAVGGRIAGAIARVHGDTGFKGNLRLKFTGSTGQSFGVWNIQGVDLMVAGECNDYLGKGMAGGSIVVVPPVGSDFEAHRNVIAGNTCLYGATGGEVFLCGMVGERYGVRNGGCTTIIEGAGDHLGEYMTNGVIVSLGSVGRNIGAGLSGGLLYIYDPEGTGLRMHADNSRNCFRVTAAAGQAQLKALIEKHRKLTGSQRAASILDDWDVALGKFWQVAPVSEQWRDEVEVPSEVPAVLLETAEMAKSVTAASAQAIPKQPSQKSKPWGGSSDVTPRS